MLKIDAPCKINLTLEILGRRSDGYHEIQSIIQALKFSDTLTFEPAGEMSYICDNPGWVAEKSLVPRAAGLFRQHAGISSGALIAITKRIPFSSGLGGESSAAAAVIAGLDRLFETGLPPGELHMIAEKIGSDVPFFLTGGTALVSGRGEKVSPLPPLPHYQVVLLLPEQPDMESKTARMFSLLTTANFTDGTITDDFIAGLTLGNPDYHCRTCNVFEGIAEHFFYNLAEYRRAFLEAGAGYVCLAGAGPVMFALEKNRQIAEDIARRLNAGNISAVLTETVNTGVIRWKN